MLTYKSSFILSQSRDDKASLLEPLGMKWVVFLLFLILEPTLSAVLDIIPFGLVALLAVKCMIVLPENTAATYIYHKIEKQLQKLEFEEYPSKLSIYTSNVCRLLALTFIKACKRLVVYVRTEEMEEIYSNFEETLKALEYKRTAVETRQEIGKSIYRRQLSMGSDLDETVSSVASADLDSEDVKKSDIRESVFMDRVSTTYLHTNPNGESYKVDAKVMTQKPNKDTGIKPQYSNGEVTFHTVTKEVSFRYDGKLQTDTLLEVKYVSKNMMVLELILRKYVLTQEAATRW